MSADPIRTPPRLIVESDRRFGGVTQHGEFAGVNRLRRPAGVAGRARRSPPDGRGGPQQVRIRPSGVPGRSAAQPPKARYVPLASDWARTPPMQRLRPSGSGVGLGQSADEADAAGYVEFPVHLTQVVLHGGGTEEQLGCDVAVGRPGGGELGNLMFLGGQQALGVVGAPARVFAGGSKFRAGPLGEATRSHVLEGFQGGTELLAGVEPTTLAAEPFAVDQSGACQGVSELSSFELSD